MSFIAHNGRYVQSVNEFCVYLFYHGMHSGSLRFFGIYYGTCLIGFFLALASTPILYAVFTKLIGLPSYRVAGAGQVRLS
jgi:hypothetical protein